MVAKISIGSSLYGALAYNGMKMNRDEGRVLGSNKIYIPPDGNIDIPATADRFRDFMPRTGRIKKPVLHISLNPHPDDRLTDTDLETLAREYLERIGFGQQPFIIYKHEDIDRHHVHIVTVNVGEDGKRLNQDFLFRRSKKATTELEEIYGLHKAERRRMDPDSPLRRVRYEDGDIKRQTANTVKLLMTRYRFRTHGEFNALLSLYGLTSEETNGKVNGREYHGLVYSVLDDNGRKTGNPLKASRLGKFASLNALHEKINRCEEQIDSKATGATRREVRDALSQSTGKVDFINRLKEKNVDVVLRYTDSGRLYGATFIDHSNGTVFNGSSLGKGFSANALDDFFNGKSVAITEKPDMRESHQDNTEYKSANDNAADNGKDIGHKPNESMNPDVELPGLDLFNVGPSVDPEEEAFIRAMRRRKKRGRKSRL